MNKIWPIAGVETKETIAPVMDKELWEKMKAKGAFIVKKIPPPGNTK